MQQGTTGCEGEERGRGLTVCNKALQDVRGRGREGTDSMQQGTTGCEGEERGGD